MAQISEESFILNQETENLRGAVLGSSFRFKNYSNQPLAERSTPASTSVF